MKEGFSGPAGAVATVTVGHYDAATGLLAPAGGAPGMACPATALQAVGLDRLVEGATVTCETVPGEDGPAVSRILAVDFSTARAAPGYRGGVPAEDPGDAPVDPAPGVKVSTTVKWFLAAKGYGFLDPGDGSPDIFCHTGAVRAAGLETLPRGATVICEVIAGGGGPQVSRILAVEEPEGGVPEWGRRPEGPAVRLRGAVKFYDPGRGFGFVVPDDGGRDVFVHATTLLRSGLETLHAGQRVSVRAAKGPRGRNAVEIEKIGDGSAA